MLAINAPCTAPSPTAASPASPVRLGDVVLARVGKHHYWPALVSAMDDSQIQLVFFGDYKELTVAACHRDGDMRRRAIRPFSDLGALSTREKPSATAMYQAAVEEAKRWKVSLDGEDGNVLREAVAEGRWRHGEGSEEQARDAHCGKLDGAIVPRALMLRASALKLPSSGQPVAIRDAPVATFRVLCEGSMPLADGGMRATDTIDGPNGCGAAANADADDADDDDDDASDSRFSRMHAPLEALEYRGFAAHPRIGTGSHAMAPSCSTSSCGGGGMGRQAGVSRASTADDALIGRHVRVPATEFPESAEPEGYLQQCRAYIGVIIAQRRRKRQLYCEVYFASDHTRCLFSRQQVLLWLEYKQAACEVSAPPMKRSRTAKGEQHEAVEVSDGCARTVRICLAGVRPLLRSEHPSIACEHAVLGIMDELPLMPSI